VHDIVEIYDRHDYFEQKQDALTSGRLTCWSFSTPVKPMSCHSGRRRKPRAIRDGLNSEAVKRFLCSCLGQSPQ
jgi:hypothetical protein